VKQILKWVGALMGIPLLLLVGVAAWILVEWRTPYCGYSGESLVEVPKGMGAGAVLDRLAEKGVVRHMLPIKLAYTFRGRSASIKAGLYRFDRPLTPVDVLSKLLKGDVVRAKFTIPEGLRSDEVARILATAGLGSLSIYEDLFADPSRIQDLDPEAPSLEGFLFPETYTVDPGMREEAVVEVLVSAFRKWWAAQGGGPEGRDVHTAVVLASLVEKESAGASERPMVAGVFLNRIRIGMPLQCDPTVVYALVRDGRYRGSLNHQEMGYESPYNTYIHRGLPPSPICNPGRAALLAALDPAPSDYLYFVSQNDGTHRFSKTLDEHNRAVARFRERVVRDGRGGSSLPGAP
jgi:UPF0755 protein